jgi:hypothetical protein
MDRTIAGVVRPPTLVSFSEQWKSKCRPKKHCERRRGVKEDFCFFIREHFARLDLEYLDETSNLKVSLRQRADMEHQLGRKLLG